MVTDISAVLAYTVVFFPAFEAQEPVRGSQVSSRWYQDLPPSRQLWNIPEPPETADLKEPQALLWVLCTVGPGCGWI